jgi:hypothetical protein
LLIVVAGQKCYKNIGDILYNTTPAYRNGGANKRWRASWIRDASAAGKTSCNLRSTDFELIAGEKKNKTIDSVGVFEN